MVMAQEDFTVEGRRVVVLGAARSGIAAAELLARRGARVVVSEAGDTFDGADRLRAAGIGLELGGHTAATLAHADLVVASPGVPLEGELFAAVRARGIELIGELELASRWLKGRVIAITGTKGKSTTTTLVGRMLTAAGGKVLVGGNIGVPVSAQVDESTPQTTHVVETSSFQLETTTTFRPWIAVWLNFAEDHLDRHQTAAIYAAAKARIFANQRSEDWAVLNADDAVVSSYGAGTAARQVWFSPSGRVAEGFAAADDWIVRRTQTSAERLVPVSAIELAGRRMRDNVVAATAVAWVAGVRPEAMRAALRGFTGLAHTMEPAGAIGSVRFVNDSKATNVTAAVQSIESFPAGVVAIMGGRFKGGDLGELVAPLAAHGRAVVAIGEAAPLITASLASAIRVIEAGTMDEAVERAWHAARPDGTVVLAPACASFDMFRDYAQRGEAFKAAVARLRARVAAAGTAADGDR
jgi:UDP-N-acetylmuramoylalanine--D-glutamate ligase